MSSPFDGAGEPYRGPRSRGPIIVLVVVIIVVAVIWLGFSAALSMLPPEISTPDQIPLGTGAP